MKKKIVYALVGVVAAVPVLLGILFGFLGGSFMFGVELWGVLTDNLQEWVDD